MFALALVVAGTLAGCSTPDDPNSGAVNTGAYPNLNIKPGVAATQLTPEEREAKAAELKGAQQGQVAQGQAVKPSSDEAQLRKLAATHSQQTLDEIESQ
jgi:hypothetical protein